MVLPRLREVGSIIGEEKNVPSAKISSNFEVSSPAASKLHFSYSDSEHLGRSQPPNLDPLTCWSHSGQDFVAILTFFVLLVDIVRFLGPHSDGSAVATPPHNFLPHLTHDHAHSTNVANTRTQVDTHECGEMTGLLHTQHTPTVRRASFTSMRSGDATDAVLRSRSPGKIQGRAEMSASKDRHFAFVGHERDWKGR